MVHVGREDRATLAAPDEVLDGVERLLAGHRVDGQRPEGHPPQSLLAPIAHGFSPSREVRTHSPFDGDARRASTIFHVM